MKTSTTMSMAVASALLLAACSASESKPTQAPTSSESEAPAATGAVTVLTHDSFALPEDVIADFEATSGIDVTFEPVGDAGTLVNQLALTSGAPLGDAVVGIDNTFASRAVASEALADYVSPSATDSVAGQLTAIDYSDVCFNIDLAAFGDGTPAPATFDDLLEPEYANMVSVSNPATSSPGLALLLATYETYGEGWKDYWRGLRDNGLKVTAGWSDTYFVDFSVPNYGGDYPIVLSYASSPPSEVVDGNPTSTALLDTCFRQVEYAGVLDGAQNPEAAKAVVDWMLSDSVQSALPDNMYVYPVSPTATIPAAWEKYAPLSDNPIVMDPAQIDAQRDQLLREWTEIVIDGQ
ncbi:thiamine ABC transporter substrate-binding protein [Demequina sp. TTPB684]|uniref:thiamine ABC transporter substrate-binding protein n=1 Tax=unclassified Demequina TaxID=2620311 RepID=UPI001CF5898D|nr:MULTISPECIES: thiamine ABC transporter substrate-binding protein [unclassified Demequina]MCB2413630.1 thiamine ABC transporter substrate-binding protein [Demequina sp. TTPB684]UPU88247.1 thiamine ABC transporter substrate-binding protein [Demequina sp. TMPB413]